jgi:hypothetical protein
VGQVPPPSIQAQAYPWLWGTITIYDRSSRSPGQGQFSPSFGNVFCPGNDDFGNDNCQKPCVPAM